MYIILSAKYWDSDTKSLAYQLRDYSPGMGRWMSRDPIVELGGLNRFSFVSNDPLSDFDLLGLLSHERPNNGLWLGIAGEFSYFTAWKLDQTYTKYGTLIQRVHMQGQVFLMDGTIDDEWNFKYTVAWRVMPNSYRTVAYNWSPPVELGDSEYGSFKADDIFGLDKQAECSTGWAMVSGVASFYEGKPIPDDWSTDIPAAMGRPAKYGFHTLASHADEYDIKEIMVSWDCVTGTCETEVSYIR